MSDLQISQIAADAPLSEDWLKAVGFKWHQFDRQLDKQWVLWIGQAAGHSAFMSSYEDLGVEVTSGRDGHWFCWLRDDSAGRYHRFIHLRHIRTQRELVAIIEALAGQAFIPENNLFGVMHTPEGAAWVRHAHDRLDRRLMRNGHPWQEIERDDTRGRALPEHMEVAEKARRK